MSPGCEKDFLWYLAFIKLLLNSKLLYQYRAKFQVVKPPIKSLSRTLEQHVLVYLQRVHLDIQVGEHAVDYAHVAQKEKLSELQLRVRQLLDQTEQISKEQNYQRVIYYKSLNLLGSLLANFLGLGSHQVFFFVALCVLQLGL